MKNLFQIPFNTRLKISNGSGASATDTHKWPLFCKTNAWTKLDMCLWNTDAPGGNKVKIYKKISKSYILTPPHPQGQGMSVKCEEPLNELTVQVWLLNLHPNFNYWTLFVSGTELRTNRQTDGQVTDGQTIRLLDAPGGPFRPGA